MAHLSGDEAMRQAFAQSQDIHDFTARQIFGIAPGVPVDRESAPHGKERQLRVVLRDVGFWARAASRDRPRGSERDHDAYFARFPDVRAYIDRTIEDGRRNGYVCDDCGPAALHAGLDVGQLHVACRGRAGSDQRAAARQCGRSHEAGDGANRSRLARFRNSTPPCCCRFTTNSSSRCAANQLSETADLVRLHMENAVELSVPLEVTLKAGRNWYDVEAINAERLEHV